MNATEYSLSGMRVREHTITVPLDWTKPEDSPSIQVFARELVNLDRARDDLPILLFLQGGPGGMGPRPGAGGWWHTALKTHRVVLLDQRGTGRSTPIIGQQIESMDARAAADYLAFFRADSIVADAELLRSQAFGGKRWSTLGQSYGGFITLTYLSTAPQALEQCYVTGGLPGLINDAAEVYRRTFLRMDRRNELYYQQFPDDEQIIAAVADRIASESIVLPRGDILTHRRFQALGMGFGMSDGFESLHWMLDTAWADGRGPEGVLSRAFRSQLEVKTGFDDGPLYMVLQEAIYAQGGDVSGWEAQAQAESRAELAIEHRPVWFTGEAVFPWMFDEILALRPFRAAMDELSARSAWPTLYDLDRLASNEVPVSAVQYFDDPYVDLELALETSARVGNMQVWVTNEYLHDGLRIAGDKILPRLFSMGAGRV